MEGYPSGSQNRSTRRVGRLLTVQHVVGLFEILSFHWRISNIATNQRRKIRDVPEIIVSNCWTYRGHEVRHKHHPRSVLASFDKV